MSGKFEFNLVEWEKNYINILVDLWAMWIDPGLGISNASQK